MILLPPLPAIGSVAVEIFGPEPDSARWDYALWDIDTWAGVDWRNVTPQSMTVEISWGADDAQGALTVPAAGSWTVKTYDPLRLLDPSNGSSPYSNALKPGRPLRISYVDAEGTRVVRQGLIDEVEYDLVTAEGSLRGTDDIELMVAAKLPEGKVALAPTTLRARATWLLAEVGLSRLVTVEAAEYDPPVGPLEEKEAPVWTHILTAAYDALYAVWLDASGVLRFRSFGDPSDTGFQIGGEGGIPVESVSVQASLASVFTQVTVFDSDDTAEEPTPITVTDGSKANIYGILELKREQKVPEALIWAQAVLDDRSGAALQYLPSTLYPQTKEQLFSLFDLGMVDIAHLVVETVQPTINIPTRVLGGKFVADTETGWTAELLTYIPAKEWSESETIPPEPPITGPTTTITNTYTCIADVRVSKAGSSTYYGAGAEGENPVGAWHDTDGGSRKWRNRCFMDFQDIPFGTLKAVEVVKAELLLRTTGQVNVAFGSTPKVILKRVTESWPEGTATNPNVSNATVYPGPACTNSGSVTRTHNDVEGLDVVWTVTDIVKSWLNGQKQRGIGLFSAGEDSEKYTTEFWDRTHSNTAFRPRLRVTMKVEA